MRGPPVSGVVKSSSFVNGRRSLNSETSLSHETASGRPAPAWLLFVLASLKSSVLHGSVEVSALPAQPWSTANEMRTMNLAQFLFNELPRVCLYSPEIVPVEPGAEGDLFSPFVRYEVARRVGVGIYEHPRAEALREAGHVAVRYAVPRPARYLHVDLLFYCSLHIVGGYEARVGEHCTSGLYVGHVRASLYRLGQGLSVAYDD